LLIVRSLALLLAACELQVVELAQRAADDREIIVLDPVPPSAIDHFATAKVQQVEPMHLSLTYPEQATAIPANCAPLTFTWQPARAKGAMEEPPEPKPEPPDPGAKPGPAAPRAEPPEKRPPETQPRYDYELTLQAGASSLRIYTTQTSARVPDESWRPLLEASGQGMLTLTLRALSRADPRTSMQAETRSLLVRAPWPAGQLYFRSGSAEALSRAHIDESSAEPLSLSGCGGDFAISSGGDRLGVQCESGSARTLALPSLDELAVHMRQGVSERFGSFDRSGTRIVRAYEGTIDIIDAESGELRSRLPLPPGARATDASWAPDGSAIVFAYGSEAMGAMPPMQPGASIATVAVDADGMFPGAPTTPSTLVPAPGRDELLRDPAYSPDGRFVVYVRGKGQPDKLDDASLWIVSADGGLPVELFDARARKEKRGATPQPIWVAATERSAWLLFASMREYASQKRPPESQQLWATWIDFAAPDQPPTATAPFWLPFQEPSGNNRRPQWAAESEP
jgi:hypothetical protein